MVSSWRPNPLLVLTTLALGALSLGTSPLSAQHISLSPAVGVYIPTQELVAAATTGTPPKQEISITVGGRFGLWFGNRIGIEATGDYAPSKLRFSATGAASTTSANIFTGSGRILIFVIPESSPVSFRISGGAGLVSRSGTAYQNSTDKNDVGGTGGFALGFRLGRILSLLLGGDVYVYKPNFSGGITGLSQTQTDVHLSFGVGIPLLGLSTTK